MLWRAEEHEAVTERPWDADRARAALAAIVADAAAARRDGFWPGHPLDDVAEDERECSLYGGSAGMIWALWALGSAPACADALPAVLARYRAAPDFGELAHPPSLLMGETGILAVAQMIGSPAADRRRLGELVHANRDHPTWELMWGSPGTMLAARACGLDDLWRESGQLLAAQWRSSDDMWTHDLYGSVTPYLSPVHGFVGNVHALRAFVDEDVLRTRVTRVLTRLARHEEGLVNWPPVDIPWEEVAAGIRVQFCHGAPGIVATLGDLMPRELAIGGGELTWRAGPLRKGPGLCHGTAGNGLAFLRLHALTGDEMWLRRARSFARHAIDQVDAERARLGRGRYTLWTGDVGVALYLRACLDTAPGVPFIDLSARPGG
jgi:hypothetical protein